MSTTLNHLHKLLPERKNILRSKSFYPAILRAGFLSNLKSKYAYGKKNRISLVIANRLPTAKYELTILSL